MKVQLDEYGIRPERAHATDAGMDLFSPFHVTVPARGSATVHTGVHIQLPPGTVGMLKSKSGLNVKHGIVSEGVIDEGYSGEIVVKLHNLSDVGYEIEPMDKITQLVILPCIYADLEIVSSVEGGERGAGGFGSTGR